jgi:taurine dioxygenase
MSKELIIKKKVGCFGAEIYNLDIKNCDHLNLLKELLDQYLVIIIKGQQITYEEQIELANIFGELDIAHPVVPGNANFPNILEVDGAKGGKNAKWHTDVSFLENPYSVSILVANEVPEAGGDTLWADLRSAYENMSKKMKDFLNQLEAVHKITPLAYWGEPQNSDLDMDQILKLYEDSKKIIPVIHPVVRIHPRTLKPSIFVNPGFTSHILNLSNIEGNNILKLLYEYAFQPEFILRHKWEKNDIVIWDNMCTAHYAINDYGLKPRKMRRVPVKGEIPFGYHNIISRKTENPLKSVR